MFWKKEWANRIFWRKNSAKRMFDMNSAKTVGLRQSQRILYLRRKTLKKKGIFWRKSSAQIIFYVNSAKIICLII